MEKHSNIIKTTDKEKEKILIEFLFSNICSELDEDVPKEIDFNTFEGHKKAVDDIINTGRIGWFNPRLFPNEFEVTFFGVNDNSEILNYFSVYCNLDQLKDVISKVDYISDYSFSPYFFPYVLDLSIPVSDLLKLADKKDIKNLDEEYYE